MNNNSGSYSVLLRHLYHICSQVHHCWQTCSITCTMLDKPANCHYQSLWLSCYFCTMWSNITELLFWSMTLSETRLTEWFPLNCNVLHSFALCSDNDYTGYCNTTCLRKCLLVQSAKFYVLHTESRERELTRIAKLLFRQGSNPVKSSSILLPKRKCSRMGAWQLLNLPATVSYTGVWN